MVKWRCVCVCLCFFFCADFTSSWPPPEYSPPCPSPFPFLAHILSVVAVPFQLLFSTLIPFLFIWFLFVWRYWEHFYFIELSNSFHFVFIFCLFLHKLSLPCSKKYIHSWKGGAPLHTTIISWNYVFIRDVCGGEVDFCSPVCRYFCLRLCTPHPKGVVCIPPIVYWQLRLVQNRWKISWRILQMQMPCFPSPPPMI